MHPFNLSYSGTTVFAEIQGVIDACVKLSGMPDLTLSFMVSSLPVSTAFFSFCGLLIRLSQCKIQLVVFGDRILVFSTT